MQSINLVYTKEDLCKTKADNTDIISMLTLYNYNSDQSIRWFFKRRHPRYDFEDINKPTYIALSSSTISLEIWCSGFGSTQKWAFWQQKVKQDWKVYRCGLLVPWCLFNLQNLNFIRNIPYQNSILKMYNKTTSFDIPILRHTKVMTFCR